MRVVLDELVDGGALVAHRHVQHFLVHHGPMFDRIRTGAKRQLDAVRGLGRRVDDRRLEDRVALVEQLDDAFHLNAPDLQVGVVVFNFKVK